MCNDDNVKGLTAIKYYRYLLGGFEAYLSQWPPRRRAKNPAAFVSRTTHITELRFIKGEAPERIHSCTQGPTPDLHLVCRTGVVASVRLENVVDIISLPVCTQPKPRGLVLARIGILWSGSLRLLATHMRSIVYFHR